MRMKQRGLFTVVILLGLHLSHPSSADLVAHWAFDGDATDSTGNGHDGAEQNGPTYALGQFEQAIEFNGANSHVTAAHSDELSFESAGGYSVAAWVYPTRLPGNWAGVVTKGRDTGNWYGIWINPGNQWVFGHDGNNQVGSAVLAGVWTHVALTYDGGQKRIYLNGELDNETTSAQNGTGAGDIAIGAALGVTEFFPGRVDEAAIYNHSLTPDEVKEAMFLSAKSAAVASDPYPEDVAADVPRDSVLSWTPGAFAASHDVYFGTSASDVNDATKADPRGVLVAQDLGTSMFNSGRLNFEQTYYWRVDEVNGAPDFTVFNGNVWSFTAEPFSIPINNITATASSSFGISGPENTINGSGLVDDLHGTAADDMWISGGIPATIEYAFDRAYKLHELWIWNSNQLIESFVGFGAKDVVIEHSVDGENWTVLDGVGPLAQAPGTGGYAHNNTIDFAGTMAQHVRVTISSVQGIAPQASLSEVRFYHIPVNARQPQPADGATIDGVDAALSWRSGREAGRHEVYLDMDTATTLVATVDENNYLATALELESTYHWRIDEVNDAESSAVHEGDTWSFSTPASLSVDDMERYKDEEFLEIWATWIDGFDDPANGALVGGAAGIPETGIVHGGSQSLPMGYDNRSASVSEATRTFDQPQDWTRSGIQSLVLYLNRGADNTGGGQVYVKINDTKVLYGGGADLPPGWDVWTQWTIDLSAVADAASVRSLTIGVEGAGATGVLYVDSIQLVKNAPTAPEPLSWFEAEAGAITAPLQVFSDSPTASAGQHIGTVDAIGDENDNPPADGVATYSFDVPEDGVYRLAFRVIITGGSNSFWVRISGMTTNTTNHASGWVRFNDIADGGTWHWDEVHSSDDGNSVVEFTLSAGTHTLEIARREDGALLDAISVTN